MPSKEVDSSEDDSSVVLEGGKHMYCHDFGLCYSYVGCFLIDFELYFNTILPKWLKTCPITIVFWVILHQKQDQS